MADPSVHLDPIDIAAPTSARTGTGWLERVRELEVRPRVVGPHARLGVVWFFATLVALVAGRLPLALLLAPCSGLAAMQAARSWRRRPRPAVPVAAGGAALLVVSAVAGPVAVAAAALVVAVLVLAGSAVAGDRRANAVLTLVIAGAVGMAGAAPVLLLRTGLVPAFVLLAYVAVHDASAYVVGTGATSAWEGPAAGVASMAAVTLAVAAVFVPPFRGATPWLLGGLALVLTPLGPYAGSALLGDRQARVPALRRLDSLLVIGPVWSLVAAIILE